MEFKYPVLATDEHEITPPQSSSSSSLNYNYFFTHQALQEGYLKPEELDCETKRDIREAILKEIEKERVREAIIAAEIAELRRVSDVSFTAAVTRDEPRYRFPAAEETRIGEMSVEERLGRMVAMKHGLPLYETPSFRGPPF